jgi:hypothetical protein
MHFPSTHVYHAVSVTHLQSFLIIIIRSFYLAFNISGHQLLTAAALVRHQVNSCRIYGGQSGTERGFLRVLVTPLPIHIVTTASHLLTILLTVQEYFEMNLRSRLKVLIYL